MVSNEKYTVVFPWLISRYFVFSFQMSNYDVVLLLLLTIDPVSWLSLNLSWFRNLRSFLYLCIYDQIWEVFSHCFFEYTFSLTLFLLSLWDKCWITCCSIDSWGSVHFFSMFSLFWLSEFSCSFPNFTDSVLCPLQSIIEPIKWVLLSISVFLSCRTFTWFFFVTAVNLLRISIFSFVW